MPAGSATAAGGGGGTVNSGSTNQLTYYAGNGTTVSGETTFQAANMAALTGDVTNSAGSLATTAGLSHPVTNVYTSSHTVTATEEVVECNSSSPLTMTLPAATGSFKFYWFKNLGTGSCTIARAGSDTIDGATSVVLTSQYAESHILDRASGLWDHMTQVQLGGDLSGTPSSATVAKVNGNTPGNSCSAHQYVNSISSSAVGSCAQPAFSDLSGSLSDNAISSSNSVTGTPGGNQAVVFEDAPSVYHYLGDGSEADPAVFANANCTGPGAPVACCSNSGTGTCNNTQTIQGVHNYANLTVGSGATLTVGATGSTAGSPQDMPQREFVARVQGTCTIAGTIAANNKCASDGCGGGGAGGSGGSGAANSTASKDSTWGFNGAASVAGIIVAKGGTASSSGAGNNGDAPTTNSQIYVRADPFMGILGGAGGSTGGSSGGSAGSGGAGVVLICGTINFTGTVNANGGAGAAGGSSTGGGGGGGGGVVIMAARTYSANSGSITVTHGNGGGAGTGTSFAGGNGADGWSKQFTLN
jgi:hypothetical protein